MAYRSHHRASQELVVRCAVVSLSDTRSEATDKSGAAIQQLLTSASNEVRHYQIIPDEPAVFESLLQNLIARDDIDAIITTGGTGISMRDQTVDVVDRTLTRPLPGFGELFRMLSWEQIGSGAMLSRATAGLAGGKLIFALPGSTAAVELGMTKLILPELKHLVYELRK